MKILNSIFIFIFSISAMLQYNDPDPFLWILLYLSGALLSLFALRGKFHLWIFSFAIFIYFGFAVYYFFAPHGVLFWILEQHSESIVQSMKADQPWIEETREFFGLLILITASVINIWAYKFYSPHKKTHQFSQVKKKSSSTKTLF